MIGIARERRSVLLSTGRAGLYAGDDVVPLSRLPSAHLSWRRGAAGLQGWPPVVAVRAVFVEQFEAGADAVFMTAVDGWVEVPVEDVFAHGVVAVDVATRCPPGVVGVEWPPGVFWGSHVSLPLGECTDICGGCRLDCGVCSHCSRRMQSHVVDVVADLSGH
jgi:hypothetical protein